MPGRLEGKTAIVTGAGQGIGEAIARVFAAEGARVVVANRTVEKGEKVAADIKAAGGEAVYIRTDMQDEAQVKALVAGAVEAFGRLDIVVHNAASFSGDRVEAYDRAGLEDSLDTNLKAAFAIAREAIPHMRKQGGGRLLYTSSVTGPRVTMPGAAYYAASKSGLNGFIRTAGMELAPDRITVNGVEPGFIKTPAMDLLADEKGQREMARYIPAGHLGASEDIAHAMLYFASDEAGYTTGQTLVVDGGSTLPETPLFADDGDGGMA